MTDQTPAPRWAPIAPPPGLSFNFIPHRPDPAADMLDALGPVEERPVCSNTWYAATKAGGDLAPAKPRKPRKPKARKGGRRGHR